MAVRNQKALAGSVVFRVDGKDPRNCRFRGKIKKTILEADSIRDQGKKSQERYHNWRTSFKLPLELRSDAMWMRQ